MFRDGPRGDRAAFMFRDGPRGDRAA